jgi:YegS/Rv2252/BmrU family lipid kinase
VPDPVFVVFNPASGKGRGARLVDPVVAALRAGGPVEHGLTAAAGDEARVAREAVARGFTTIVAVGGDGTWGGVANGILQSGAADRVRMGLVPGGTGCDLAKSLGIPANDILGCARIIRGGATRVIDVGRIEDRYFVNVAGFGFDIAVIEDSKEVRWLRGSLLYVYCALRQMHRFPGFPVTMAVDGGPERRREMLMLVFANAKVFGGGSDRAPGGPGGRASWMPWPSPTCPCGAGCRSWSSSCAARTRRSRGGGRRAAARSASRFDAPPAYETDGEWNRARSAELVVQTVPAPCASWFPAA